MIKSLLQTLTLSFSVLFPLWLTFSYAKITEYTCQQNAIDPCSNEITTVLAAYKNQPLLLQSQAKIRAEIAQKLPHYRLEQLYLQFPHRLSANFTSKIAILNLNFLSDPTNQFLSEDGYVLPQSSRPLPRTLFIYEIPRQSVRYTDPIITFLLHLTKALNAKGLVLSSLTVYDPALLSLKFNTGTEALLTSLLPFDTQVNTLQRIFKTTTMQVNQVVDIRYDIPVIKDPGSILNTASSSASPAGILLNEGA